MAHSSGGTGGTESNALQQLISPQELNDRFNDVLSMVRGERSRRELGTGEYVVTKESSYWGDFLNTANVPDNKVDADEYKKVSFTLRGYVEKTGRAASRIKTVLFGVSQALQFEYRHGKQHRPDSVNIKTGYSIVCIGSIR